MLVMVVRSLPVRVGNFLVTEVHLADQALESLGGLDGVQIFALDILDQSDLEQTVVGVILNYGGNFGESGQLGGPKAALACDQFKWVPLLRTMSGCIIPFVCMELASSCRRPGSNVVRGWR